LGPRNEARGGANGAGAYPEEFEEDGGARDVAARLKSFAGINGDPRQDVEGGSDFVVLRLQLGTQVDEAFVEEPPGQAGPPDDGRWPRVARRRAPACSRWRARCGKWRGAEDPWLGGKEGGGCGALRGARGGFKEA